MKKQIEAAKKFVAQHKTKLLVAAVVVTTTVAVIERIGIAQHNEFLKEHDLYDEFYAQDDEETI